MHNIESLIKKHKTKTIFQGIGIGIFGSIGMYLTYSSYVVMDFLIKNNESIPIRELFPSLGEQAVFGDLLFANAVAWAVTFGLSDYARKNYKKFKELKQRREIEKYF